MAVGLQPKGCGGPVRCHAAERGGVEERVARRVLMRHR